MGVPPLVTLDNGRARAELAPSAGARLMRWSVNGRPVLHWPADADWSAPEKIRGGKSEAREVGGRGLRGGLRADYDVRFFVGSGVLRDGAAFF